MNTQLKQMNKDLLIAREVAEEQYTKGHRLLAADILANASRRALQDLHGVEERFLLHCSGCQKKLVLGRENAYYAVTGTCFDCARNALHASKTTMKQQAIFLGILIIIMTIVIQLYARL